MTELLYQTDSYLKEFEAKVTRVTEDGMVVLDRTAFYPGGGGQPYDVGELVKGDQRWPVTKTRKKGVDVMHVVTGEAPAVGTRVSGRLDWECRYQVMRTHSVTGGNMEPLKGRMDFEFETMRQELVQEIEESINAEVAKARPVSATILPREIAFQIPDLIRTKINLLPEFIQEVRTVEIKGLDLQADGGTHVANTAEVGRIRVADYKSKGKINKRIYVELDE